MVTISEVVQLESVMGIYGTDILLRVVMTRE